MYCLVLVSQNKVIQVESNTFPVSDGLLWVETEEDIKVGAEYQNGIFTNPEAQNIPTYQEQRKEAYGSVSDQLDMIYWDSVNNTTTWRDHIEQVKLLYPKT